RCRTRLPRSVQRRKAMDLAFDQRGDRLEKLLEVQRRHSCSAGADLTQIRRPEYRVEQQFISLEESKDAGAWMGSIVARPRVFPHQVHFMVAGFLEIEI